MPRDSFNAKIFGGSENQIGMFAVEVVKKPDGQIGASVQANPMSFAAAEAVMHAVVMFFLHCNAKPETVRESVEDALRSAATGGAS